MVLKNHWPWETSWREDMCPGSYRNIAGSIRLLWTVRIYLLSNGYIAPVIQGALSDVYVLWALDVSEVSPVSSPRIFPHVHVYSLLGYKCDSPRTHPWPAPISQSLQSGIQLNKVQWSRAPPQTTPMICFSWFHTQALKSETCLCIHVLGCLSFSTLRVLRTVV